MPIHGDPAADGFEAWAAGLWQGGRHAAGHVTGDFESLDDPDLMARVVAGDEDALAAIYDRHADVVYGTVLRFLGDRQGAEEVVQDAFLVIWRQRARYHSEGGSLVGWLLRIARNKAIDRLRSASRRPAVVDWAGLDGEQGDDGLDRAATLAGRHGIEGRLNPGPEDLVTQRWSRSVVRSALSAMPEAERQALELAYDEDLTQMEIAERLGWPLGTVKSRTRRALAALRTVLEGVPSLLDGANEAGVTLSVRGGVRGRSSGGADAAR